MNSVLPLTDNTMLLMTLSSGERRSVSPMTPSPTRDLRGIRLFRAISRKLSRRSAEDIAEDSRSSSSSEDSKKASRSLSPSSSDAGSEVRPRHHHSTSAESIRRVFQSLHISARSQSCSSPQETAQRKSKKPAPKRILRAPVTYTYVRGLSGLPTQRVPKNQRTYRTPCACSMQYMQGLNR